MNPSSLKRSGAALVNTDNDAYRAAVERKRTTEARENRILVLECGLAEVTEELRQLKEIVKCLSIVAKS
jgi:hypothetical protein